MALLSVGVLSYKDAAKLLNEKRQYRVGGSVKIGHNTWLEYRDTLFNNIAIRYHQTDIVTILSDDTYVLNSGGYSKRTDSNVRSDVPSSTTKQRINALAPGRLYQHQYHWYVGEHYPRGADFFDGIRVDRHGKVVG